MSEVHLKYQLNADVEAFLLDPVSYMNLSTIVNAKDLDAETDKVGSLTTHCAQLFFAGDFVVKTKLPVAYSYLNTTHISDRARLCLRELELNKPGLPEIYLDVLSIIRKPDNTMCFRRPENAGDVTTETVVEWCLVMKRFNETNVLDELAKNDSITMELAAKLGFAIARYHQSLIPFNVQDGDLRIEEVLQELNHEFQQLGDILPKEKIHEFKKKGTSSFTQSRQSLLDRSTLGSVRRCHGDLHLRNIVLLDNTPKPFDALEFDERLATTDVLYDLAFLLMDLAHRGLTKQENIVFNQYLLHSSENNLRGLSVMSLFLFCRAGIKAMTSAQGELTETQKHAQSPPESLQYLDMALDYVKKRKPIIIAIGGFSGSGKSTIAARLSTWLTPSPGAALLRSDAERKVEFNCPETDHLPDQHYTKENSKKVYRRLFCRAQIVIDSGYPIIVDAAFLSPEERNKIEDMARTSQIDFYGFWLMAPVEIMQERIRNRVSDASDATINVLQKQLRANKGEIAWQAIDTSGTIDETLSALKENINR